MIILPADTSQEGGDAPCFAQLEATDSSHSTGAAADGPPRTPAKAACSAFQQLVHTLDLNWPSIRGSNLSVVEPPGRDARHSLVTRRVPSRGMPLLLQACTLEPPWWTTC